MRGSGVRILFANIEIGKSKHMREASVLQPMGMAEAERVRHDDQKCGAKLFWS
jgi:hypothetical protein